MRNYNNTRHGLPDGPAPIIQYWWDRRRVGKETRTKRPRRLAIAVDCFCYVIKFNGVGLQKFIRFKL